MICEQLPCECNAKPKAARVRPKPSAARKSDPSTKPAAARTGGRELESPVQRKPVVSSQATEEQLVFAACLRVLEPILHVDEKSKYSGILNTEQTVKERAALWKARRSDG